MVINMIIDSFDGLKIFGLDFIHPEDLMYLVTRFIYNLFWVFIPAYFLYFRKGGYREYFFTYIIVSMMVFQICLLLGSVSLRLGFALGLFAIFGILRYRTNPIPPREMTYLFLVIGISIKNAVSNENISFIELVVTDVMTILVAFLIELYITGMRVKRKKVIYDRLDLAKPENYEELKKDLSQRLGVEVVDVYFGPADLIKDCIELLVFFKEPKGIRFYDASR